MTTVEVHLTLAEESARKLRELAQAHNTTESSVIEQALDFLSELDDTPWAGDYWLSVATMREDWDAMPDDWIADEANDAVSPR